MRLFYYIGLWLLINGSLSGLWVFLETGPELAFLLGMLHGGLSQAFLLGKYTRVW
jgi:hypothetical protein